jgi:hypothetical protein
LASRNHPHDPEFARRSPPRQAQDPTRSTAPPGHPRSCPSPASRAHRARARASAWPLQRGSAPCGGLQLLGQLIAARVAELLVLLAIDALSLGKDLANQLLIVTVAAERRVPPDLRAIDRDYPTFTNPACCTASARR